MRKPGQNAFDIATESSELVNDLLADTDGEVCSMEYTGAIGYHINVAKGETDPEYLWKVALLQAFDESIFDMMYVDASNPRDAKLQVERQLRDSFDQFTAEHVADIFEVKLTEMIEVQKTRSVDGGGERNVER